MTTKIIIRLVSTEDALLGWAETTVHARGDGSLWATENVVVPIEAEGLLEQITAHWVDVNVVVPLGIPSSVHHRLLTPSMTLAVVSMGDPVIRVGAPAGGLHPVVVRKSIAVTVPTGSLGSVSPGRVLMAP